MQLDKPPPSTALSRLGYEPDDGSSEESARWRLRRNRSLATGLLLAMGATYAATHLVREPGFGTLLVRSGAEAGIVGGLADWFAVTALFRYPLGLRIPHTAIIPNNKDRIGRTLGRFVERHFLTEEILLAKLRKAHVGQRIAEWLAAPETAPLIAGAIIAAVPHLIRTLESHDIHDFANRTLGEQLRQADLAPIIGRAIEMTTTSGEADVLFERAIGIAVRWLEDNRSQIDELVRERSRWWIPKAIDRRIAAAIVSGIMDLLQGLAQPDSDVRLKFREALATLIDELLNSPEQREQLNVGRHALARFLAGGRSAKRPEALAIRSCSKGKPRVRTQHLRTGSLGQYGQQGASDRSEPAHPG
jgi:uncharacterized membrane-anchored protein YjiN (DUF445 family)